MTLVTMIVVMELADSVQDFITNDTFHYFTVHPAHLIVAGLVGIAGGLIVLVFSRLPPWKSGLP